MWTAARHPVEFSLTANRPARGAARAGATMHLMPAIAVLLSALFLGEYPVWFHFAGIVLILAGVGLSSSGRAQGKDRS